MVIRPAKLRAAFTVMEVVLAMGILATVMLPLAYSYTFEQKLCRAYFHQAVALEIVDGEMEILAAGEWKKFSPGQHVYEVMGAAAKNLPPGQFLLTLDDSRLELSWRPASRGVGGAVTRRVRRELLL